MADVTPFLCFPNGDAAEAAALYLRVFPGARKVDELVSDGLGPWPAGTVATVTLEIKGQVMIFLNQGPPEALTPAFSFFVACDSQEEIDRTWEGLLEGGGRPMGCGWLTDRFGVCWQVTPRQVGTWIRRPKAMEAMMGMVKLDMAALERAAREE